jgi:hypothetical protein
MGLLGPLQGQLYVFFFTFFYWCGAAVSISEQLPEDGLVRPKNVANKCDFNDIFKI